MCVHMRARHTTQIVVVYVAFVVNVELAVWRCSGAVVILSSVAQCSVVVCVV